MIKPNYKSESILNMISSIGQSLDCKLKYKPLKLLPQKDLKYSRNIVLMVIDGLGFEFLNKHGKDTIFNKYIKGKITSTFPSSTSAAIPALLTGQSPKEHGMTGWYMFLKELGNIIIPLPFVPRLYNNSKLDKLLNIKHIFDLRPIANNIKAKPYIVQHKKIINSGFTIASAGRSERYSYTSMSAYFKVIKKIIKSSNKKKYIFAYYPEHDTLGHKFGIKSKKVLNHFKKLNSGLSLFLKIIENTNTTVIITADHGQIDIPKSRIIDLEDHSNLKQTLAIPLCGEHRFAYAYIKPDKVKQFKKYIKTKLSHACNIYESHKLLNKNLLGLFKPHPSIKERIGDYVILMKDNYAIYDRLKNETKKQYHIGDHGGFSKEEMFVPLIVIKK